MLPVFFFTFYSKTRAHFRHPIVFVYDVLDLGHAVKKKNLLNYKTHNLVHIFISFFHINSISLMGITIIINLMICCQRLNSASQPQIKLGNCSLTI